MQQHFLPAEQEACFRLGSQDDSSPGWRIREMSGFVLQVVRAAAQETSSDKDVKCVYKDKPHSHDIRTLPCYTQSIKLLKREHPHV
jgi:hypothetical protein